MTSNDSLYPLLNNTQYIIAGPGPRDYYNHSPGTMKPLIQENGPFPMLGNIGSVLANDPLYKDCTMDSNIAPNISSSPNCTVAFKPDMYTKNNTCGAECTMKYPESYGLKDFGFPTDSTWNTKVTNAGSLHAFDNLRAAGPGQGPGTLGSLEWLPNTSIRGSGYTSTGFMDPNPAYEQVNNFLDIPGYENLSKVTWTKFTQ